MPLKEPAWNMPKISLAIFTEQVNIVRSTAGTVTASGEQDISWATIATCIDADVQPYNDRFARLFPGTVAVSSHVIFLSSDTDVKVRDRIQDYNNNQYEVQEVKDWHSHIVAYANIAEKT